ncbi:hypothetical protein SAMN05444481_13524 [Flavobacterium frigidimaris]|nr:hypothetical protein SAMN05444481_13524 [Flavobacterium frigidimaris]
MIHRSSFFLEEILYFFLDSVLGDSFLRNFEYLKQRDQIENFHSLVLYTYKKKYLEFCGRFVAEEVINFMLELRSY